MRINLGTEEAVKSVFGQFNKGKSGKGHQLFGYCCCAGWVLLLLLLLTAWPAGALQALQQACHGC
jgi:hypothetical protein